MWNLPLLVIVVEDGVCEGSVMIIEHQSHSQCNTDPKYPVFESECGDV